MAVVTVAVLLVAGLSARVASASARVASAAPAMPRPGFTAPTYYSVGADAVVVADFTGDGRADVAVARPANSSPSGTVALLVQTPSGTLAAPQYLAGDAGNLAFLSAVAADINGDGLMDLLVGSSNGVDVFEQHEGGLLPARHVSDLQAEQIRVADINGDGIPDLVVDMYSTAGLRTMLGLGGGQFGPPVTVSTGSWSFQDFAIGDVTGDGIPDIVGHDVITFEVRAGHGDGTFAPAVNYSIPWPNDGGHGLAIGDFNGDGRADVAVTNSSNNPGSAVHLFYQTAAGTFGPAVALPSLDIADMIKAVDVNHDGRMDLVVAHGGWDYAGVYLQQPDGTFAPEQLYYMGRWYFDASSGLDVGDTNGDGLPDIVVGSSGGLVVLRQTAVVARAPTTLLTQGSAPATVGGPISDTATLAGGFYPTGTIIFALFGPTDTTCSRAPTVILTTPVNGNGTYTSPSFTTTAEGTYRFKTSYSGDTNNAPTGPVTCDEPSQGVAVAGHAIFTYPYDGQPNVDTTKPFTWKTLAAAQGYELVVGTRPYGTNLVNSGVLPANQSSFPMPDFPAGETLYATLLTKVNGAWSGFQAIMLYPAAGHATFTSPTNGQTNVNSAQPFTWATIPGAQGYILVVGTTVYGTDLVNSGLLPASQSSYTVPNLPKGKVLYATLLTKTNGTWTRYQLIGFIVT